MSALTDEESDVFRRLLRAVGDAVPEFIIAGGQATRLLRLHPLATRLEWGLRARQPPRPQGFAREVGLRRGRQCCTPRSRPLEFVGRRHLLCQAGFDADSPFFSREIMAEFAENAGRN